MIASVARQVTKANHQILSNWLKRATTVQPQARRRSPQGDVELMTEKQILGFEPASRPEYVGNEHHEQDRKHLT
jgi:hypothetical protein